MSKAALAIEAMISEAEKKLHNHIRDNKEVIVEFGILRNQVANLKEQRIVIARNRIETMLQENNEEFNSATLNRRTKNSPE